MNRNRSRNVKELVNTDSKTYSYVKEARKKIEYVNYRHGRCVKIKIEHWIIEQCLGLTVEIKDENFLSLMKTINLYIQEAQQTVSTRSMKKMTRHIS